VINEMNVNANLESQKKMLWPSTTFAAWVFFDRLPM
jgi:hypothetical protein